MDLWQSIGFTLFGLVVGGALGFYFTREKI